MKSLNELLWNENYDDEETISSDKQEKETVELFSRKAHLESCCSSSGGPLPRPRIHNARSCGL